MTPGREIKRTAQFKREIARRSGLSLMCERGKTAECSRGGQPPNPNSRCVPVEMNSITSTFSILR